MDLGKPQRRYSVEPDEIPVPQPSRRDEPARAPEPASRRRQLEGLGKETPL